MGSPLRPAPAASPIRRAVLATIGTAAVLLFVAVGGFPGSPGASPTPSSAPASTPAGAPTEASSPTAPSPVATPAAAAPAISGIACDVDERTTYHVHAHLNIRIRGQLVLPPADVGVTPVCLYWLHTHQGHGVIHVEAPAEAMFSLGQFFEVWGKPLSATQVGDATVGPGESIFAFVNGEPFAGDPRTIALDNLASIELQVGKTALEPLPYTFPADLE